MSTLSSATVCSLSMPSYKLFECPSCTATVSIYTHTHPFNGPLSGTTREKGTTNLDFTEARDSEWQRHQLGHMQVCR